MSLQFTGKEREAKSGLDYFGARYFSGAGGRWGSPDQKQFTHQTIEYPQKWNGYAYVRNNPLARFDPDGLHDHHFVVRAVWEKLSLSKSVADIFEGATIRWEALLLA